MQQVFSSSTRIKVGRPEERVVSGKHKVSTSPTIASGRASFSVSPNLAYTPRRSSSPLNSLQKPVDLGSPTHLTMNAKCSIEQPMNNKHHANINYIDMSRIPMTSQTKGNHSSDISVNAPRMNLIPKFSLSIGKRGLLLEKPGHSEKRSTADHRRQPSTPTTGHNMQSFMPSYEIARLDSTAHVNDETKEKGTINVNTNAPVTHPTYDIIHVIRHSTFHMSGGKEKHSGSHYKLDINTLLDLPKSDHGSTKSRNQERVDALEGLLELSAHLLGQQRLEELSIVLQPFGRGTV